MRAFKTVNDSYIEPISFIVPRRAEVFQDDIYPPAVGSKPAMSSSEWFGGKDALPAKIDLGAVYNGEEPNEVAADHKPPSPKPTPVPPPTKKAADPEPAPDPAPTPSALSKGPPPSMTTQTASIKDLASKYNDDNDNDSPDDNDDSSSFEEVAKPIERPSHPTSTQPAPPSSSQQQTAPPTTTRSLGDPLSPVPSSSKPDDFAPSTLDHAAASTSTQSQIASQREPLAQSRAEPLPEQLPPPTTAAASGTASAISGGGPPPAANKASAAEGGGGGGGGGGGEVLGSLAEIKALLEEQTKTMSAQNETIGKLTREVDRLRAKMGE